MRKIDLQTLDHIWQGSGFPIAEWLGNVSSPQQEGVVTVIILLLATLLAVLFHRRLIEGWSSAANTLFSAIRRKDIFDNTNKRRSIVFSFAIPSIFYGAAIHYGGNTRPLWVVLVVLALYFILREIALRLSSWFTGKKQEFDLARMIAYSAFSLIFVSSVPIVALYALGVEDIRIFTNVYLGVFFTFFYAIYLKCLYKILISTGFSLFSSILYLCALEILPTFVAIKELTF